MGNASLYEFYMHKYEILYERYLIELKRQSDRAGVASSIIGCIGMSLTLLVTIFVTIIVNLGDRNLDFATTIMNHHFLVFTSSLAFIILCIYSRKIACNLFQSDDDIELFDPTYISVKCTYKNVTFLESLCEELPILIEKGNWKNNIKNKRLVLNLLVIFICFTWLFMIAFLSFFVYVPMITFNNHDMNNNCDNLENGSYLSDEMHNSPINKNNSSINKYNLDVYTNSLYKTIYHRDPILIQNILMLIQRDIYK